MYRAKSHLCPQSCSVIPFLFFGHLPLTLGSYSKCSSSSPFCLPIPLHSTEDLASYFIKEIEITMCEFLQIFHKLIYVQNHPNLLSNSTLIFSRTLIYLLYLFSTFLSTDSYPSTIISKLKSFVLSTILFCHYLLILANILFIISLLIPASWESTVHLLVLLSYLCSLNVRIDCSSN